MNPQQDYQNMGQTSMPGQMNGMPGQPMGMPGQMSMPGQPMGMSGQQMQEPQIIMPDQQMMQGQMPQMAQGQMAQGQVPGQMQAMGQNKGNIGAAAMAANKAMPVSPTKEAPTSTQSTLLISELRDNVVIMKDGSFRAVVACKSINFDLMSDMEREGVEYSYQNFLNSLKFTTQILIRSQRVDIGPYLERLVEIRRNNDNMLLGVLMDDYINFVDILSQEANIMDKSFFVIIPYYTSIDMEKALQQTKNFFKSFSKTKAPDVTRIDRMTYDKAL